jgi:hypothetical protein
MSTRIFLGVKTAFTVPKVEKIRKPLTFRVPKGLLRPVAGKIYLYVLPVYNGFLLELVIF